MYKIGSTIQISAAFIFQSPFLSVNLEGQESVGGKVLLLAADFSVPQEFNHTHVDKMPKTGVN